MHFLGPQSLTPELHKRAFGKGRIQRPSLQAAPAGTAYEKLNPIGVQRGKT
jgi:hypothetical protein